MNHVIHDETTQAYDPRHGEALSRREADLLGSALALAMVGEYRTAQEMLDDLAEQHRSRMIIEGEGERGSPT